MQPTHEAPEVSDFLRRHLPLDGVDPDNLRSLTDHMEIRYFRRGTTIAEVGEENDFLSIVRSGAVELKLGGTELNARLGEGGCFGYPSLLRDGVIRNQVIAIEDSLLYRIAKPVFLNLHRQYLEIRNFFDTDEARRLRGAVDSLRMTQSGSGAADTPGVYASIGSLMRRAQPVIGAPDMTVAQAAALMTDEDVSTLPVLEEGRLAGIITDKDLRRRVLGVGLDTATLIGEIMTPEPITANRDMPLLTALIIMADRHVHHLPIMDADGRLAGMISSNDILSRLGSNAMHIAKQVAVATEPQGVADATARLPDAVVGLVRAGVDADHIARYASTIGEGAHRAVLKLAEHELGPPPVPYALVCFGSLARSEQALGSDQDNGFILADGYDPQLHDAYFAELARRMCDGLDSAGYRYCPGEIMATNPIYRRRCGEWKKHFRGWIDSPDAQAILESGIFFDIRAIAGEATLVDQLRTSVLEAASGAPIFLSFIARSAASTRVPLGFFRNFLLQHDAKEGRVLDLKAQAIAPIVDLARTHALAMGLSATNTIERLRAAGEAGSMSVEAAQDLIACFEFVRDVRFRHQADQIDAGEAPSNKLDPERLSRFDREHLRDAFKMIRTQLDGLRSQFAGGVL